MKVAHVSDIHIDEHNRFNETVTLLDWLDKDILDRKPDLIVIAGDSAPVSVRPMTPRERVTLADWYVELAGIAPLVVIAGNHDVAPDDVALFGRLRGRRHAIWAKQEPDVFQVEGKCVVAVLPWPSKAYLLKHVPENNGEALDDLCHKALAGIMRGFRVGFEGNDTPRILVGHLNVRGADAGGFRLVGQDVECDQMTLESSGADAVLLGHIHKYQRFGDKIAFCGSPRRVDHGEEEETKGYLIWTVDRGQPPILEFRPTPVRAMETIEIDLGDPFSMEGKQFTPGSQARLVLKIAEEDLPSLDLPRLLAQLGAEAHSDLKIDKRITPKTRVRSEAIQEAKTDAARLQCYLEGVAAEPATIRRVQAKLESLTTTGAV